MENFSFKENTEPYNPFDFSDLLEEILQNISINSKVGIDMDNYKFDGNSNGYVLGQFDGIRVGIRDADLDGTADGKISQIEIFKSNGQTLEFIDTNPHINGMELAVLSTGYIDTNNDIFNYPDTQYKVIVNTDPSSSGYRKIQLFERNQNFLLGESDTANVIIIQDNGGLFSITLAESSYSQSITTPEPNSTRQFQELLEYAFLENKPQESFEFWNQIQKTGEFPICPSTSQYSSE